MKRRLVEVRWTDAALARYPDEAGVVVRRSVGWLMKRDKREIWLAQTCDKIGREDILAIPRPNVRKLRRLR